MRRVHLTTLTLTKVLWDGLTEALPPALEAAGLAPDDDGDEALTVFDHGEGGCVITLDDAALARRVALELARRAGAPVDIYEVTGTAGPKRNRFRTTAQRAMPDGALKPHEGRELDLEDDAQTWGGGTLEAQAQRVMREYAQRELSASQTLRIGYRKRAKPRASTPRVATLLALVQKSKRHEGIVQPDGRVELKVELATGGKQSSFCSAAEYDELRRLLGEA
ncbi:MAG: hypothetical protein ACK4N5_24295 [Myxococcales bacterium]